MTRKLTALDIDALAAGAAFLGTGGGGDPYIGGLLCKAALKRHGPVELLTLDELPADAAVVCVAAIGAPTVLVEKLMCFEDADVAVSELEAVMGRRATAVIPAEIGGLNATLPLAFAASRGLPVLDADGMGRAFPTIEMTTFNVEGVSATPMVVVDEHGQSVLFRTATAKAAEDLARPVVAAMGAAATAACYWMSGAEARRAAVGGTLTAALEIGRAVGDCESEVTPVERLLATLRASKHYRHAYCLFEGKVTDVVRETTGGWVFGSVDVTGPAGAGTVRVEFQNENLVARAGDRVLAIVPDLISIVDRESGRAITTEGLRYGQRVAVIACSAPAALRTPQALEVMSPAAFRLAEPFTPVEQLHGQSE